MKIRIKTAHGYLSFQPDGTIQYRPTAGAWEELELEAWDLLIELPPTSGIDPDPDIDGEEDTYPYGIEPSQTAGYVQQIKDALIRDGVNISGPCGAFEICRNVALGLRDTGAGLLFKDTGNMCQERSTDIVCYKDFEHGSTRIVDVLGDAGGENNAMWIEKGPEENVAMDRWRDPTESTPTHG